MKRDTSKKKLVLDRNIVKILGPRPLRAAVGGAVDGEGSSVYPICPLTHSQEPGGCAV